MFLRDNVGVVKSLHATLNCKLECSRHLLDIFDANLVVAWCEGRKVVFKVRFVSFLDQAFGFWIAESKSKFLDVRCDFNQS